jgi:hypothetical protein
MNWMNIKTILHYFIPDQRNLGMSMKIERSSVDQVKARFSLNKKKLEEKRKDYDLEQRVAELREEVRPCFADRWTKRHLG